MIDNQQLSDFVDTFWQDEVMESLKTYIEIPNKSPAFDANWARNGHMAKAVAHVVDWVKAHCPAGLEVDVHQLSDLTPTILLRLPGELPGNVLVYGHLDKQPEFEGWHEGLGPWTAVERGDRLYGRGGADDGYAIYSAITALLALQEQGLPTPTINILIECSEESGSPDLLPYLEALASDLGTPDLVIALDSTCGDYERLWITTSLRGMVVGNLRVDVLSEGAHSGAAGGIMPSSFRLLRQVLSRLEDENTGTILPDFLCEQVPALRRSEAEHAAGILGENLKDSFAGIARPISTDPVELLLNNTWQASMEVTGAEGLPTLAEAGNVLRPQTTAKLALRLPPTLDATEAGEALKELLEQAPPDGAAVAFSDVHPNPGWHAPPLGTVLAKTLSVASQQFFGEDAAYLGCGGSIPFMKALAERAPQAQFVVTGVLGPLSNAHGPNEFLHLPTVRQLTKCVAMILSQPAG